MKHGRVLVALAAVTLAAAGFACWPAAAAPRAAVGTVAPASEVPAAPVTPATPSAPVAQGQIASVPPPADLAATLLLPDGTRLPVLNGARGAPPLAVAWPAGVPFAAVIRTERSDAGIDWYVHENGIRSTTEMRWRDDLGRMDALTRVAQPGPVPPARIAPH